MSAAALLDRLHAAGVRIVADLALEADAEPPADLLAEVETHKGELLVLLVAGTETDRFEERAAIIEYDAGLPRRAANLFAVVEVGKPPIGVSQDSWTKWLDTLAQRLERWSEI